MPSSPTPTPTKHRARWTLATLLAALLGGVTVLAQTVQDTLTWTLPTTREDNTSLAPSEIREVRIYSGTTPGGTKTLTATVAGAATSTTVPRGVNPLGTRCYEATVVDTAGRESARSNEACRTILATPSAPTNLRVS